MPRGPGKIVASKYDGSHTHALAHQLLWEPKTLIYVINTADTERGIGEPKLQFLLSISWLAIDQLGSYGKNMQGVCAGCACMGE